MPANHVLPATVKSRPGRALAKPQPDSGLSDRVRAAIHYIVFDGAGRREAAKAAGLADKTLLLAFAKPAVLRYLREQQEVLRSGARPAALRRIVHLVDNASSEKVQLDAAKYIDSEGASDRHAGVSLTVNVTPGYVIDLSEPEGQLPEQDAMDANALIDITPVPKP